MKIIEIAKAFYNTKILHKTKEEDKDEEIGGYSMNEGEHEKIFGFRREIVRGVVIFFSSVLILACIFASSDEEETPKEAEALPVATESEIASTKKAKTELPNDYETLIAMNQAKEEESRRQALENAKKAEQMQKEQEMAAVAAVNEQSAPAVLPAIPRSQAQVMPVLEQIPQTPEVVKVEPVKEEKPRESTGKYKSAISFAISSALKTENQDVQTENQPDSAKVTTEVKSEYKSPNKSTLGAGTVIPVRLLTGINTDVAGQVMVQVLTDIYDTATGTKLLIPQGSRLTGSYDKKAVANGRVPVTFQQLALPNGGYWTIGENIVAIDGGGYTGIKGKVHHHTGQKVSAGAIGSAVAALG